MLEDPTTINTLLVNGSTLVLIALSLILVAKLAAPLAARIRTAVQARRVPPATASN